VGGEPPFGGEGGYQEDRWKDIEVKRNGCVWM